MNTNRLSAQDTTFIFGEDPRIPLHVGGLGVMEAGPLREEGGDDGAIDIDRIRREKIASLPQVRSTRTLIALATFKETARIPLDHAAIQNLKRRRK